MKKFIVLVLFLFSSVNAFTAPLHSMLNIFQTNNLYRDYRPPNSNESLWWSKYAERGPTVLIYLHPTINEQPYVKSDPLYINCNGYEIIISPGESYACTIQGDEQNGQFYYNVAEGYEKNGADVSIVEIDPKDQKPLLD